MPALPRPNLKPRPKLLIALVIAFAIWVGLLTWIYVTQIVLKH